MTLSAELHPLYRQLAGTLRQRQQELLAVLQQGASALSSDNPHEVLDFKDVAAEETRAVVDEASYAHAAEELARIGAALRRVDEGSYGLCKDCCEPIDVRRLRALPETPYCTACQSIHERPGVAGR